MAKFSKIFRNNLLAISYYKHCKRLSDNIEFFSYKKRCYKNLGVLYMSFKPKLSILYLSKYLLSAWKLDDRMGELTAYDLLGKYFFYLGDLKSAQKFHNKMILGNHETSLIKRMGIDKLNRGSIGY
jgi:hypothetical protein